LLTIATAIEHTKQFAGYIPLGKTGKQSEKGRDATTALPKHLKRKRRIVTI
jgi:hypothetical protein